MSDYHVVDHHIRARLSLTDGRQMPELPADVAEPFIFASESSNNSLDAYYTHMTEATLRNFAADAAAGVQFLDSHNARNLGYGRTFAGRVETIPDRQPRFDLPNGGQLAIAPPGEYVRAVLETYTVPGIRFGGGLTYASTDDFIRAARAGIARDISVGFYGGDWVCDICGGNYRDYRACQHMAGFIYPAGDQGDRLLLATVAIDGARLAEHSAVYDGATPQAMIIKAGEMARAGILEPEKVRLFEVRHQVQLPERRVIASGVSLNREVRMNEVEERLLATLRGAGAPAEADAETGLRWLVDERAALLARVAELTPLADSGRQYRVDMLEAVVSEGVRAMGAQFPTETYRQMLADAGIPEMKRLRDSFAELAQQRLPAGRQTADTPARDIQSPPVVPDTAYE